MYIVMTHIIYGLNVYMRTKKYSSNLDNSSGQRAREKEKKKEGEQYKKRERVVQSKRINE